MQQAKLVLLSFAVSIGLAIIGITVAIAVDYLLG